MTTTCPKCGSREMLTDGSCRICLWRPLGAVLGSPSGIEAVVCHDIAERQRRGIAKYGVTVAENPLSLREWLQHAYEETLDKAIYLKRAIVEMENVSDQATASTKL